METGRTDGGRWTAVVVSEYPAEQADVAHRFSRGHVFDSGEMTCLGPRPFTSDVYPNPDD